MTARPATSTIVGAIAITLCTGVCVVLCLVLAACTSPAPTSAPTSATPAKTTTAPAAPSTPDRPMTEPEPAGDIREL